MGDVRGRYMWGMQIVGTRSWTHVLLQHQLMLISLPQFFLNTRLISQHETLIRGLLLGLVGRIMVIHYL